MLHLGFWAAKRFALGSVLAALGVVGCTAGVQPTHLTGTGGGGDNAWAWAASIATGLGGINISGNGGSTTGAGGTLPVPPGCGDGINNQGGIEQCDDGNTTAGDGCNGICHVEPNWTCPSAGACARSSSCGDGKINPGEVCDDKNKADGDGCNATCTVQDGRYVCMAGKPCVLSLDLRQQARRAGRELRRRQPTANDGCSATCQLEQGWVCPAPGSPCIKAPRCGDGVVQVAQGEVCDDGNITEGDGCSANCKVMGANCICVPGMKCTCPQVLCGDGIIAGAEKCDDGNTTSGDGCSSTCTIERGYVCPLVKAPCVPDCGDGILTGNEPCDPGIAVEKNACSSTCRWNPGYACTGSPVSECHTTKCGDGKKEGAEGCDDGNTVPYDGCSATCVPEPACPSAARPAPAAASAATASCCPAKTCDDGNNLSGDGCSASCKFESGFMCTRPPLGDSIQVPAVYRDFSYHTPNATSSRTRRRVRWRSSRARQATLGTRRGQARPIQRPPYRYIASAATFAQWYTDVAGVNKTYARTMTLYLSDAKTGVVRQPLGAERRAVAHHEDGLLLRQRRPRKARRHGEPDPLHVARRQLDGLPDPGSSRRDADFVHHERRELGRRLPDRRARRDAGVLPDR